MASRMSQGLQLSAFPFKYTYHFNGIKFITMESIMQRNTSPTTL